MGDNPIENVLGLLYGRVGKIEKEENAKKKKYLKIRHETESERDKFGKKIRKYCLRQENEINIGGLYRPNAKSERGKFGEDL